MARTGKASKAEGARRRRVEEDNLDEFIRRYSGYLRIDEHELDRDIKQQPERFYVVAEALAIAISKRDEAKKALTELEAELDEETRRTAKKAGDKITEREIASDIRRQPEFIEAGNVVLSLSRAVAQLGALKEAFEQRRYMLREMAGTYASGYWGDLMSNSGRSSKRDRDAELAREDQANARKRWRSKGDDD